MGDQLKNLWQWIAGQGAAKQAAQGPGGSSPVAGNGAVPQSIQPQNTGSSIMQAIGDKLMPNQFQQNPQQLQGAVDKQMAYLQGLHHGAAAAQQAKKTPAPAKKTPQAQIDPSQPIHDIFHGLISNLQ